MDRLRAMSNARRLFNGPLRKCSKAAAADHRPWPVSSSSLSSAQQHARSAAAARAFSADAGAGEHSSAAGGGGRIVVESQFRPVDPLDVTLPEYIWRNVDKWEDKPMIVSGFFIKPAPFFIRPVSPVEFLAPWTIFHP